MTTSDAATPAGWYADPAGSDDQRYWDGTAWTHELRPASSELSSTMPEPSVYVGEKMKDKHVAKVTSALNLPDDERLVAVYWANNLRPTFNSLAITNARLLAVEHGQGAIPVEVLSSQIAAFEISKPGLGGYPKLSVTTNNGKTLSFGSVREGERETLSRHLDRLSSSEPPARLLERAEAAEHTEEHLADNQVGKVSKKGLEEIRKQCRPGEVPRLIIGSGMAGALAGFEDRCMIVKKGAMTGLMTGALGGGRVSTFMYSEITGIEYNAGMITGVLEVLTASYDGSRNKDFWNGTLRGRNANADDPFTLSNTLPLAKPEFERARPLIDELRSLIAAAKSPTIHVHTDTQALGGLAGELAKLAELHQQGLLDDTEFRAAKAALLEPGR